jgi:hypothetical protein
MLFPSGASWSNPATIAGYPGEHVILTHGINIQDNYDLSIPHYLIFDNFDIQSGGEIVFRTGGNVHHIRLTNSLLTGNGGFWISTTTDSVEVVRNVIHDLYPMYNPEYGQTLGNYGSYVNGTNMLIDGNTFYNVSGYAIHLYNSGTAGLSGIIRNNIIRDSCFDDGERNYPLNAVVLGGGSNILFYNNLVYNNFCNGGGAAVAAGFYNGGINNAIYNNTIWNNPNGPGIGIDVSAPNTLVKNNIVYNNGGSQQIQDDASGTILDHNLLTNPLFVNTGNPGGGGLKVQAGSAARNGGVPIPAIATDIEGAPRGQGGAYDIGAYEYDEGGTPPPIPSGNIIYVRKTGGSPSNNCTDAESTGTAKQTIADACQCMTVPGKVMMIEGNGNVYTEEIDTVTCPITGGNGPSYTDATRIEGYGTTPPIIQSPVGTSGQTLFVRNATDKYLIFKNLIIDAANRAGDALILYGPAHHIRFDTVTFKNATFDNALIYAASNIEMIDTIITTGASHGLALAGAIDTFMCMRCHIMLNGAKGVDIRNSGAKTNISIMRTEIDSNATDGLDSVGTTNMVVQNTIIRSNGGKGARIQGTMVSTKLYNNTVTANTGNGVQCDSGATTTEVKNTIIYNNTAGNLVDNCTASVATNLTTNPTFASPPSNLHLQSTSTAINTGTPLANVTEDYDGNIRPRKAQYDIGAYESDFNTPITEPPTGPDVTVLAPSKRGRSMMLSVPPKHVGTTFAIYYLNIGAGRLLYDSAIGGNTP